MVAKVSSEDLKKRIIEIERNIKLLEKRKKQFEENTKKIISSAACPLCLQPLSLEYKHDYLERIARYTQEIDIQLRTLYAQLDDLKLKLHSNV
ncbi:hypothetical protein B9Q01_09120 [Candidatus Marsarchaeota G1 archaeon OSP_D]|uniref:Zinc-hook domain-containing protein n=2 Tax=Candidatus Marsarchaeota group 1 TaxID=2203770 RepID=A0A2R6ACR2_9ARCH|nr:MAG: hypothetical protein B9Q01_09120 [Candidatus Marsarchaeota G1 archaeon OSP_D]PSN84103.1 MAG: hypothetical protein B9Q02_09855 [Candidatus Marsarchaeota G1 archaeon BE_D]